MKRHYKQDSHTLWLQDIEYRGEFGSESAKLEVAAALAAARETAGITQAALAEQAGVSQAYIAKLENGNANPTIGNIGRLLAYMWYRPSISLTPMEAPSPFESVFIENQSASDFSDFDMTHSHSDNLRTTFSSSLVERPASEEAVEYGEPAWR